MRLSLDASAQNSNLMNSGYDNTSSDLDQSNFNNLTRRSKLETETIQTVTKAEGALVSEFKPRSVDSDVAFLQREQTKTTASTQKKGSVAFGGSEVSTSLATDAVLLSCQPNKAEVLLSASQPRKISELDESESDEEDREFTVVGPEKDYVLSFLKPNNIRTEALVKNSLMASAIPMEKVNNDRSIQQQRHKFLAKLAQKQVWISPIDQPKSSHTLIIFDWDDTLLCTSQLTPLDEYIVDGEIVLPKELTQELEVLDDRALFILEKSITLGKTIVVTNAAYGWVEASGKRFLPKTFGYMA